MEMWGIFFLLKEPLAMSRKVFDHRNMRAVGVQWVEGRGVPDLYNKQDRLLSKELSLGLSWESAVATQGLCLHPFQIGCQWNAH